MTACNCRRDGMGVLPEWECATVRHRVFYTEEYVTRAEMAYAEDEFRYINNLVCERPFRASYYAKRQTA